MIQVYFSPKGGCTDAIVKAINAAKKEILLQAYSFTAGRITQALVAAKKRKVKVSVILDHKQGHDKAEIIHAAGVIVLSDGEHAIAHNKIIIVDRSVVVTGSFNFSYAAENNNAENLLVIDDPKLAALYVANWRKHAKHSKAYF